MMSLQGDPWRIAFGNPPGIVKPLHGTEVWNNVHYAYTGDLRSGSRRGRETRAEPSPARYRQVIPGPFLTARKMAEGDQEGLPWVILRGPRSRGMIDPCLIARDAQVKDQ